MPITTRQGRDFPAEEAWLRALPSGPETDAKQDEWERDPAVQAWRASKARTRRRS